MEALPRSPFTKWDLPARRLSWWRQLSAAQFFVGSFLLLIGLGTVGLKLLPGLYTGPELTWLDALFTATSAVCVTGLIVVDTATYFTTVGQAFILLLIQLGGLGMITFTSLIIIALGRRLSLRHEALSGSGHEVHPEIEHRGLFLGVLRFTFGAELAGAALLYLLWVDDLGWGDAAWHALFHSVSAFCNAGFSTFSASMIPFRDAPLTLATVMALVVVGGLGFLTLEELRLRWKAQRSRRIFRISVHTRLVLVTTGVLVAAGWVLFAVFEWDNTLRDLSPGLRVVNALFLSVTPRTAGFNNIDYALARENTKFLTILLMSVGGSPGSTAGGIKTTTLALLVLVAWCRIRGRTTANFADRTVPEETIQRAVGLSLVAFAIMTLAVFLLTTSEWGWSGTFLGRMFEVVSAFNTVGLSMNVTPELTPFSKVTVVALMFLGRVGTITFAAALVVRGQRRRGGFVRYANEDVVVG